MDDGRKIETELGSCGLVVEKKEKVFFGDYAARKMKMSRSGSYFLVR